MSLKAFHCLSSAPTLQELRDLSEVAFDKMNPPMQFTPSESFSATAIAIAIIRKCHSTRQNLSELIESKAVNYLIETAPKPFTDTALDQFVQIATSVFRL